MSLPILTQPRNSFCCLEQSICKVYLPHTQISEKLRRFMFNEHTELQRFLRALGALWRAILCAHHHPVLWNHDTTTCLWDSISRQFRLEARWRWVNPRQDNRITSTNHFAPIEVRKSNAGRCCCQKAGLNCIHICMCPDNGNRATMLNRLTQNAIGMMRMTTGKRRRTRWPTKFSPCKHVREWEGHN